LIPNPQGKQPSDAKEAETPASYIPLINGAFGEKMLAIYFWISLIISTVSFAPIQGRPIIQIGMTMEEVNRAIGEAGSFVNFGPFGSCVAGTYRKHQLCIWFRDGRVDKIEHLEGPKK
jgi:hypothetical protein